MGNLKKLIWAAAGIVALLVLERFVLAGTVELDTTTELPASVGFYFKEGQRYTVELSTDDTVVLNYTLRYPTGNEAKTERELTGYRGIRAFVFQPTATGNYAFEAKLGQGDFQAAASSNLAHIVVRRGDYRITHRLFDALRF